MNIFQKIGMKLRRIIHNLRKLPWSFETTQKLRRMDMVRYEIRHLDRKILGDAYSAISGALWTELENIHKSIPIEEYMALMRRDRMHLYADKNKVRGVKKFFTSPSGRWELSIDFYQAGRRTWKLTKGTIRIPYDTKEHFAIYRNYSSFWHCFVDHLNGNEYLLCGEDYQGLDLINLDTRQRWCLIHAGKLQGFGWCISSMVASPDGNLLVADGCFWGGEFELRIMNFFNPEGGLPLELVDYVTGGWNFENWVDSKTFAYSKEFFGIFYNGRFIIEESEVDSTIPPEEFRELGWLVFNEDDYYNIISSDEAEYEHQKRKMYREWSRTIKGD